MDPNEGTPIEAATTDGRVKVEDLASGDHREVTLADMNSRQSGPIGVALDTQAEASIIAALSTNRRSRAASLS